MFPLYKLIASMHLEENNPLIFMFWHDRKFLFATQDGSYLLCVCIPACHFKQAKQMFRKKHPVKLSDLAQNQIAYTKAEMISIP